MPKTKTIVEETPALTASELDVIAKALDAYSQGCQPSHVPGLHALAEKCETLATRLKRSS